MLVLTAAGIGATTAGARVAGDPLALPRAVEVLRIRLAGGRFIASSDVVRQQTIYDCGPAALANLLRVLGRPSPGLETLSTLAATTPRGTTLGALAAAARALGVAAVAVRAPRDAGRAGAIPAPPLIAWVDRRHFVVVEARDARGRLRVVDPQLGRYEISERAFARRWSGAALTIALSGAGPE